MSSFFAEFVHTDNGVTCSDSGFIDLSTAQECSGAVNYAMSFNGKTKYIGQMNLGDRPKGCIIEDSGLMYFNAHSTGLVYSYYRNICRKGNI